MEYCKQWLNKLEAKYNLKYRIKLSDQDDFEIGNVLKDTERVIQNKGRIDKLIVDLYHIKRKRDIIGRAYFDRLYRRMVEINENSRMVEINESSRSDKP